MLTWAELNEFLKTEEERLICLLFVSRLILKSFSINLATKIINESASLKIKILFQIIRAGVITLFLCYSSFMLFLVREILKCKKISNKKIALLARLGSFLFVVYIFFINANINPTLKYSLIFIYFLGFFGVVLVQTIVNDFKSF